MKKITEITTTNKFELTYAQITELESVNNFIEQAFIVNAKQRTLCRCAYIMYEDLKKASNKDALEMACDYIQMSKSTVIQMSHVGEILEAHHILIPDEWGTTKIAELWKVKGESKLDDIKEFLLLYGKKLDYMTVKELRDAIKEYNERLIEVDYEEENTGNDSGETDGTEKGNDTGDNGQDNGHTENAIGIINRLIECGTGYELDDSDIADLKYILKFAL